MLLYINLVLQITLIAVALLGAIAFSSFIVPYHVSHFIFIYNAGADLCENRHRLGHDR